MLGLLTSARLLGINPLIDLADDKAGPSPYFLVDAADVLADDAEPHDTDADEEIKDSEKGEQALGLGSDYQPPDEQVDHEQGAQHRYDHAEEGEDLKRDHGKARHEVEVQTDQVVEPVLGFPGGAGRMLDLHFRGDGGKAVRERRDKGRGLFALDDTFDDILPVRPQHAPLVAHADVRDFGSHTVNDF